MSELSAQQFIHSQKYGVLASHCLAETGYPYGSITPYIISQQGDIAIFISDLAEHTRNIIADPKVSLTIFDPADAAEPAAGTRISCLAIAELADCDSALREQYSKQFPAATVTLKLADFHFYLLKIVKARFIGGFGNIKWLTTEQLKLS